jgi:hypothetical protein
MAKVKIVQIAMTSTLKEYLDDKGRVWYRTLDGEDSMGNTRYKWEQLDLPDEPEEGQ